MIVAWLVFPLVPVILEDAYYQICDVNLVRRHGSAPIHTSGAGDRGY